MEHANQKLLIEMIADFSWLSVVIRTRCKVLPLYELTYRKRRRSVDFPNSNVQKSSQNFSSLSSATSTNGDESSSQNASGRESNRKICDRIKFIPKYDVGWARIQDEFPKVSTKVLKSHIPLQVPSSFDRVVYLNLYDVAMMVFVEYTRVKNADIAMSSHPHVLRALHIFTLALMGFLRLALNLPEYEPEKRARGDIIADVPDRNSAEGKNKISIVYGSEEISRTWTSKNEKDFLNITYADFVFDTLADLYLQCINKDVGEEEYNEHSVDNRSTGSPTAKPKMGLMFRK